MIYTDTYILTCRYTLTLTQEYILFLHLISRHPFSEEPVHELISNFGLLMFLEIPILKFETILVNASLSNSLR